MDIDDICLQCGTHVFDGRPYCCDECESRDSTTSPSLSTASSALSSPQFGALAGARAPPLADVPALLPSALGAALRYDRYASARYIDLDDEDEDALRVRPDTLLPSVSPDKAALHPFAAAKLTYARQPSATNQRSTIPTVHTTMTPSRVSSTRTTPSEDDESVSGSPNSPRRSPRLRYQPAAKGLPAPAELHAPRYAPTPAPTTPTPAQKRRNRASLPAYFQLLAVSPGGSGTALPTRPPRMSPPAARAPLSVSIDTPTATQPPSPVAPARDASARGRGRQREIGEPSASRERPRERSVPARRRGRAASPHARGVYEADESEPEAPPARRESTVRGRRRGDELDGGRGPFAPGFGNGRTGLRARASSPSRERGRPRVPVH